MKKYVKKLKYDFATFDFSVRTPYNIKMGSEMLKRNRKKNI